MKYLFILILSIGVVTESQAQLLKARDLFSRADSLRGQLTPLRTCYDINYYHLDVRVDPDNRYIRSEEHTSELQSLMRISYAVFYLKKQTKHKKQQQN